MTASVSLKETPLPRQVRERMERIKALQDQPRGEPAVPIAAEVPPQPGEATGATPAPPTPTETPPTQQPGTADLRPFHDPNLKTDPRAEDPTYWRQRLSVLQGRMRDERQEFEAKEADLRAKVSELQAQVKQLQQAKPAAVDTSQLFTPEQLEALGQDQAQAIAAATFKVAQQQVEAALAEQRSAAETQRTQASERAAERQKRQFFDDLEEAVPDWAAVNARQDWLQWLRETDPRTGRPRQAALTAGEQAFDAQGVAAVFDAFKASLAPRPTPPVAAPRSAGGTPSAPAEADLSMLPPSPEEIRDYYKRKSVRGGKGVTEAEQVAFEKRLKLLQPS